MASRGILHRSCRRVKANPVRLLAACPAQNPIPKGRRLAGAGGIRRSTGGIKQHWPRNAVRSHVRGQSQKKIVTDYALWAEAAKPAPWAN
jgi:hypothetical protein